MDLSIKPSQGVIFCPDKNFESTWPKLAFHEILNCDQRTLNTIFTLPKEVATYIFRYIDYSKDNKDLQLCECPYMCAKQPS